MRNSNHPAKVTVRGTNPDDNFGDPVTVDHASLTPKQQWLVSVAGLSFDGAKWQEQLEAQGKTALR